MKLDLSPRARASLGFAAVVELRKAPDAYSLAISKGRSGWGGTLVDRSCHPWILLANVNGLASPTAVVEAVMEAARPKPKPIQMYEGMD